MLSFLRNMTGHYISKVTVFKIPANSLLVNPILLLNWGKWLKKAITCS